MDGLPIRVVKVRARAVLVELAEVAAARAGFRAGGGGWRCAAADLCR